MTTDRYWYSDILRQLAYAASYDGDLSILNNGLCQDTPRRKRPRDADNDSSDIFLQACPEPSTAGKRHVLTGLPSYVQQQQQLPNFSLPMNSNELGKLPVYGQFQFSDSGPSIPIQSLDDFVDLIPGTVDMSYDMQGAYATNSQRFFEDQMMGGLVDLNSGTLETSSDFAARYTGNAFDVDNFSYFGATPAMDNTTMAMWSAAPTNFEYVLFFSQKKLSVESFVVVVVV